MDFESKYSQVSRFFVNRKIRTSERQREHQTNIFVDKELDKEVVLMICGIHESRGRLFAIMLTLRVLFVSEIYFSFFSSTSMFFSKIIIIFVGRKENVYVQVINSRSKAISEMGRR